MPTPLASIRLFPHGGAPAPFGLDLVLGTPAAAGDEPEFVTLSDREERCRVLLAVIKGDADSLVELCALKLAWPGERDETNLEREERWRRERERLQELRALAPASFPRVFQMDGEASNVLPPLFHCKSGQCFFSPPCPHCWGELTTCHDDELLAKNGLPAWSDSASPILHCAACAESGAGTAFWSERPPARAGRATVGTPDDLVDALGRALVRDTAGGSAFPCAECREAAYSVRDTPASAARIWRERWKPFCFAETPYLVTGLSPLTFDELADLLGGRPPEELRAPGAPDAQALATLRIPQEALFGSLPLSRRFLFVNDGSGFDAAEVFALKLVAFKQLVTAVSAFAQKTGAPHLSLQPRHLMADLGGAGDALPAFWAFQLRLFGVASAPIATLAGAGEVVLPPPPAVPYAAPEVAEFHLAGARPAEVVITELKEPRRSSSGFTLLGRLADAYGLYPAPRENDLFVVTLRGDSAATTLSVAVRCQPGTRPTAKEVLFVSESVDLTPEAQRWLQRASGIRLPSAAYRIYPDFRLADLHSLGVLLLRLLLGNDGQDVSTIARGVNGFLSARRARGLETEEGWSVEKLATQDPELATLLDKSNVFYQAVDRSRRRPNAIPPAAWDRAIALALRLMDRASGSEGAVARLASVLEELDQLLAEVFALLFDRQALHLEIQHVLAEALQEASPRR